MTPTRSVPDLRLPLLGLAAWMGALAVRWEPVASFGALAAVVAAVLSISLAGVRWPRRRRAALTAVAVLVVGAGVGVVAVTRLQAVRDGPVARLAEQRAVVTLTARVTDDPARIAGRFGDQVLVRVEVSHRQAVLVFGDTTWERVAIGERVRLTGRLAPSDDDEVAATVSPRGPPVRTAAASLGWRASEALRTSIRQSVAHRPQAQAALVPALVDGDDTDLPTELTEDFRTTGLTHLTAVSGTNLTLVVGFLLVVARWAGVRGRWLAGVGAAGIVGFVLLARTEPSVLRAAAMGAVALLGLGRGGWHRGVRGLGAAVVVLLLLDPRLAVQPGFALSVLATGGILLAAPAWRDAMGRWLPRWLAEAVAVPAAAQLACTPLVAAISGQVSLVAVLANLLVAPLVGPATVLGLLGGLVGLASDRAAQLVGILAGWCVAWIIWVAQRGATLPGAVFEWSTGAGALAILALASLAVMLVGPYLLRHRAIGVAGSVLVVAVVWFGPPTPRWPVDGWVLAACDVGQGDALAVRVGPSSAVVVDAGPDGRSVDGCLRRLDVKRVPLLVLTHFHADHVDGIAGVLRGRSVDAVEVTRLADPPGGVAEVERAARGAGLTPAVAPYGVTRSVGDVTLQVLWPRPDSPAVGPGDGSTANAASVVLLVEVAGVRLLLTGDLEPPGQAALARALPGLRVDILKVPHHGSPHQDLDWLESLGARFAVVSVGADNDYGHPAPQVLEALSGAGTEVLRTDRDGDVLFAVRGGRLVALTRD
ncbi:ComEC/Rec2 family competence protein [Nocardioides agariphilus]